MALREESDKRVSSGVWVGNDEEMKERRKGRVERRGSRRRIRVVVTFEAVLRV